MHTEVRAHIAGYLCALLGSVRARLNLADEGGVTVALAAEQQVRRLVDQVYERDPGDAHVHRERVRVQLRRVWTSKLRHAVQRDKQQQ